MKRKRFSVEQIVAVVKQAELGASVAEVIRKIASRSRPFIAGLFLFSDRNSVLRRGILLRACRQRYQVVCRKRHAFEGRLPEEMRRTWIPASAGMTTQRLRGYRHASCLRRQASRGDEEGLDSRLHGNDDGVNARYIPAGMTDNPDQGLWIN